jgi:hypothetical protein
MSGIGFGCIVAVLGCVAEKGAMPINRTGPRSGGDSLVNRRFGRQEGERMIAVTRRVLSFIFICAAVTSVGAAQEQSPSATPNSPAAAAPAASGHAAAQPFDVNAAVEAYLAKMSPEQRARSNAYFEGGYWLQLWDFLSTVFVM